MSHPPRVPFRIMTHEVSGVPVVRVRGEICYATVPSFEGAVARAASGASPVPCRVVVDLADIEFMDSEGLKAIVASIQRFGERGVEVRLVAREGGSAVRLFEKAEVRERLPLYRSIGSAVESS